MLVQTAKRMFLCPSSSTLFSHVSDYYKVGQNSRTESTVYHQLSLTKTCPKKMMQEKKKDVQLQAMWFAAGTAAVMACLQRAILVSFMEQWRMLVFLVLNLLLLAILFTSTHNPTTSTSSKEGGQESSNDTSSSVDLEVDGKKWRKQSRVSAMPTDPKEHHEDGSIDPVKLLKCSGSNIKTENVPHVVENEDQVKNNEAHQELSKEELNRRAEAFIAKFRQQLLCDAKVGNKSCKLHYYSHVKGGEIMSKRRAAHSRRHHC